MKSINLRILADDVHCPPMRLNTCPGPGHNEWRTQQWHT